MINDYYLDYLCKFFQITYVSKNIIGQKKTFIKRGIMMLMYYGYKMKCATPEVLEKVALMKKVFNI